MNALLSVKIIRVITITSLTYMHVHVHTDCNLHCIQLYSIHVLIYYTVHTKNNLQVLINNVSSEL